MTADKWEIYLKTSTHKVELTVQELRNASDNLQDEVAYIMDNVADACIDAVNLAIAETFAKFVNRAS